MRVNSITYSFNNFERIKKADIKASSNSIISDVPKFYVPTLISFKGKDFREDLEEAFKKGDENELFLFLDESLRERAKEKKDCAKFN